ncbi:MAG: hypothetical protein HY056_07990 [Proteobacteria bacterium]|nr:hypothetical protein [Pseudomonadota bacterium]
MAAVRKLVARFFAIAIAVSLAMAPALRPAMSAAGAMPNATIAKSTTLVSTTLVSTTLVSTTLVSTTHDCCHEHATPCSGGDTCPMAASCTLTCYSIAATVSAPAKRTLPRAAQLAMGAEYQPAPQGQRPPLPPPRA